MRSTDERAALAGARARDLIRRKERRMRTGLSALSLVLFAALSWAVAECSGMRHSLTPGELAGSSLLADSAGGYVLVAVLSFAAAVAVTTLCFRYRRKQEEQQNGIRKGNTETEEKTT